LKEKDEKHEKEIENQQKSTNCYPDAITTGYRSKNQQFYWKTNLYDIKINILRLPSWKTHHSS